MTNRSLSSLVAVVALGLCACGGKDTVLSHNNPGTGSSTLKVSTTLDATQGSSGYQTDMKVTVRDVAGNPVSGATVSISNGASGWGTVPLVEAKSGSGDYLNSRASFPSGDFTLSVQHPSGNVQGVVLGGPGVHSINGPKAGAIVPANQPLQVSWTTPVQALNALLTTKNGYAAASQDTGTFTIPGANNPPTSPQTLNIARYNEVNVAGGLPTSTMRVTVETSVDYTVQ